MNNSRTTKLAKNTLVLTISNLSSKLLSFIFVPLYTYILTTEQYGTADIITTTVSLVTPIFTILASEAILRFSLDEKQDKKQLFSVVFYVYLIGTILLSVITAGVGVFFPIVREYIIFFLLYYVTINANEILLQFGKGIGKITLVGIAGVIASAVLITFNIIFLVVLKLGIEGYLLSFILSNTISTIFLSITLKVKTFVIPYHRLKKNILKDICEYTLPMIPNSISWWISNSSSKYVITFFLGSSLTGIYSIAHKIPSFLSVFVSIFMSAWQISAVEGFGTKECTEFYEKIYKVLFKGLTTICAGIMLLSEFLGKYLFLNEFEEAWIYCPILLLSALFHALSGFMGTVYTSAKKTKFLFYSTAIGALMNVILSILLVQFIGVFGATIAAALSYFIIWVLRTIDSRKIMKMRVNYIDTTFQIILLIIEATVVSAQIQYYKPISFVITMALVLFNTKTIFGYITKTIFKRNEGQQQ